MKYVCIVPALTETVISSTYDRPELISSNEHTIQDSCFVLTCFSVGLNRENFPNNKYP